MKADPEMWFFWFRRRYGILPTKLWVDSGDYRELLLRATRFVPSLQVDHVLTLAGVPVYER